MKILELNIYGYGQFHQRNFTLKSASIQVIYGKNEAGKSTIMSFIQSILFGFPAKIQNANRYEPKQVNTYGGALLVETDQYGKIKIERLPGKAAGEVTLYLENGATGKKEMLDLILEHFDKSMYQSIFSFDIHGIQQVSNVSADELGRFLLSSGMLGTDALFQTESILLKKQDLLYKPNGKKPEINEALNRLKTIHSEMLKARDYIEPFEALVKEKELIESQLSEKEVRKLKLEARSRWLAEVIDALPLWLDEDACLNELAQTKEVKEFPADGLKRMDEILAKMQPLQAEKNALIHTIQEHKQIVQQININEQILRHQSEIEQLRETYSAYETKKEQHEQLFQQYKDLSRQITEEKKKRFNEELDDEAVLSINTSVTAKEEIREIVSAYQQSQQKKQMLDQQFERAKENLEESEHKLTEYLNGMLEEEERKILEKKLKKHEEIQRKGLDAKSLQEEYARNEKKIGELTEGNQTKNKQNKMVKVITALLLVLCAGWVIYQQQWFILPFLLGIAVLFFLFLFQKSKSDDAFIKHLREKQKELNDQIEQASVNGNEDTDIEELKGILWKNEQFRRSYEMEKISFGQTERAYHRIVNGFDEWEKEMYHLEQRVKNVYHSLQMSSDFSPLALPDLIQTLIHLQKNVWDCSQIEKKMTNLKASLDSYENQLADVSGNCGIEKKDHLNETLRNLTSNLHDALDKKRKQLMQAEKISDAQSRLAKTEAELTLMDEKKQELLNLSKTSDAEEFRAKAEAENQRKSTEQKLKWIQQQLQAKQHLLKEGKLDFTVDYKEEKLLCDKQLKEEIEQGSILQRRLTELNVSLANLEQSGLYSELKQKYELEKMAVKQLAHKWAVFAAAKDMLNKTIEYNRSVRLPNVLKQAESFFTLLTSNNYTKIFLPDAEQTLIVERKDGSRFIANELSQATAEQLYISLRLALARHLSSKKGLPIIIDDGFVNFDFERTKQVLSLLDEFSKSHQVIFFTCQDHLLPLFEKEQILSLKETEHAAKQVSIGQRLL
ncbi:ATP-binding protein [Metabacillus idriensis]|uniref:ATP-binding protein n=1 Tax=Metabacillus idriensis TaxID=324768 RepID=UPI0017496ED8|nr:AAA family ATPase [Metabacillus idriensis]